MDTSSLTEGQAHAAHVEVPSRVNLGKGTVWMLVARLAFLGSGYALHIGLARLLGPSSYGVIGIVLPVITLARVVVMDGPRQAVSKFTADNARRAGAIRRAALCIEGLLSAAVVLVLVGGATAFALLLRDASLAPYIRLVAPMVPLTAVFSVYLASLNGLQAFGRQAMVMFLYSACRAAFALVGALLWGLTGAVLGLVGATVPASVLAYLLLPRGRDDSGFPARQIAAFSMPMVAFSVADALLMYLDVLFVKAIMRNQVQVGYYSAAATVAQIPYYALLALADTLLPVTSRLLKQGRRERARHTIGGGLRYGLMLLAPGVALVSATARPLTAFIYSSIYAPAGDVLAILIWGQAFYAFSSVLIALLVAEGKPSKAMAVSLSLLPVSAVLNLVLVPRLGLTGAACSTATATLIGLAVSLVLVCRDFGRIIDLRSSLAIVGVAALVGGLAVWWRPSGSFLVPTYILLLGIDVLLLVLAGELGSGDLDRLCGLVGLSKRGVHERPELPR